MSYKEGRYKQRSKVLVRSYIIKGVPNENKTNYYNGSLFLYLVYTFYDVFLAARYE